MQNNRLGSRQNLLCVCGVALAVTLLMAPSGVAQQQRIDLDGNPLNGKESTIDTKVIQGSPVQFENIIVNNAMGAAFTFSWPGAGPGGFDSILTSGPDVGTKWVWTTASQVYTIQTPAAFATDTREVPVLGQPPSGVQGPATQRVFDVVGKSILPTDVTLSDISLTSSLVTFFSPEQTLATCSSTSVPGQFTQTLTNTSGSAITFVVEEEECCPEPAMALCDDGCQFYLTDEDNCGGCGNTCGLYEYCDSGICFGGESAAAVFVQSPEGFQRKRGNQGPEGRVFSARSAPLTAERSASGGSAGGLPESLGTWTEMNAGELPVSSEEPIGAGPLSRIDGSIGQASDVDMYRICLSGGEDFSATVPRDPIDAQLFLFDSNGLGVYSSDDDVIFVGPPVLPAEDPLTPLEAGVYYLAVSRWDVEPESTGGAIFANEAELNGPTGPGGGQAINGWDGLDFYGGYEPYSIHLTGAVHCVEAPVCGAPTEFEVPPEIPDGESVTVCQVGSVAGREIFTRTSVVVDGKLVGEGPCGMIVPDLNFVPRPFVPSPVSVVLVDETGDGLLQPGETGEAIIEVLNLGTADMLNPIATLSSAPNSYNPETVTFLTDTSAYPDFPAFDAPADCDTTPVFDPKKNIVRFALTIPPEQEPDVGRVFRLRFQGDVGSAGGLISVNMPLVIGIGRGCDPATDLDGETYDDLEGLLYPVSTDLVPANLPPNTASLTFNQGIDLPLRLRLQCASYTLGPGDMDEPPRIVSILDGAGEPVSLDNINATNPDPADPFFECGATFCEFGLRTGGLPLGTLVVKIRMPDSRLFHVAITTVP